ncbi:MAG: transposase [Chloroflexi bacterium]|nr:transposase [Chloroflexota bacterium]
MLSDRSKQEVSDELWNGITPLLPAELPKPKSGRRRYPGRAVLTIIRFVLRTGIPGRLLS